MTVKQSTISRLCPLQGCGLYLSETGPQIVAGSSRKLSPVDPPALAASQKPLSLSSCGGVPLTRLNTSRMRKNRFHTTGYAIFSVWFHASANAFRRTVMDTATDSTGSPCSSLTRTQISGLRRLGRL
jgi:hypothetical protein